MSYNSYEDNSGTTDDNSRIYKYKNSITVDKNYQITITKKGTDINQLTGKAVKVISSSKYNFINGELVKIYKTRNIHKKTASEKSRLDVNRLKIYFWLYENVCFQTFLFRDRTS